jgi:hypothetical protein
MLTATPPLYLLDFKREKENEKQEDDDSDLIC